MSYVLRGLTLLVVHLQRVWIHLHQQAHGPSWTSSGYQSSTGPALHIWEFRCRFVSSPDQGAKPLQFVTLAYFGLHCGDGGNPQH